MAACFGGKEENVSPETMRRWAHDLDDVLTSPAGRARFRGFLARSNMDDAIHTLTFWEMCHDAVPDEKKRKKSRSDEETELLIEKGKGILSYAEGYVNLDAGYLQRMHKALHGGKEEEIVKSIVEAKKASAHLLDKPHTRFSHQVMTQLTNP